ncbi:MAG: transglycosylase domain-containing protein, partial [Verrucomicrobiota bacterium]
MNFLRKHPRLSGGLAILFGTPLLLFLAVTLYYQLLAFGYPLEAVENLRERTLVLDRHGESIGHVYGHGENRLVVNVDEVSPAFIDALLAREDSRFYRHSGVDYRGVIRAARRNYQEGRAVQGASTLTMQLARNSFDRTEKTLHRKMLEIAIARRIERRFSKDEILGHYMNRIYFGSGLYGIERAAQGYFMKPAAELTIAESALLAGIIRGPSRFSPFRNEEAALGQQRDTLARMVKTRSITAEQAEAAKSEPLQLRPPHLRRASPGYVIQEVYAQLGERLQEDQVFQGGLRIFTTIDADLQQVAQGALEEHLQTVEKKEGFRHAPMRIGDGDQQRETDYLQGALIALDNQTGGILAMVGGRDFDDSPFNRALHAERQVGSVFKTFVYAQGFSSGLMPGTLISDGALSIPDGSGAPWQPSNSDGSFGGPTPAADGLIRSRNTMSIRVGQEAGVDASRMLARQAGFATALPNSPVSFLGAFESTPIAVTSAYSIFPNFGERKEPHLISRIEDAEGNLLFESPERSYSVLSPGASMLTSDVLARVMKEGTGRSAAST